MKITGVVIMLIGVVGLLFFAMTMNQTQSIGATTAPADVRQDFPIPLVMGILAVIGGALIFLFGGRGYVVLPKTVQTP